MKRVVMCLAAAALAMSVVPLYAQEAHTYSQEAIERGGQIFQSGCARCHGAGGDELPGVNLASGRFIRVTTDEELAQLIVLGIPGTGMPSNNLPAADVNGLVAYLRSLASGGAAADIANTAIRNARSALPGDAGRGKAIVEGKGQCLTCHSVGAEGGRLGPDLSGLGIRRPADLQKSIVDPGAEIRAENRTVRLVTRDGATVTGQLLNHDSFTVQLLDSKEQLRSFVKVTWTSGLDERGRPIQPLTPTPEGTRIEPGILGGTNWFSPSYSPRTGLFYCRRPTAHCDLGGQRALRLRTPSVVTRELGAGRSISPASGLAAHAG